MKVSCPNCGRIHDVSGLAPHSTVTCACAQMFRVPAHVPATTPLPDPAAPKLKPPPEAVWSLVLGLVSMPITPICLGPFASVPGLILGYAARNKIDASPDAFGGRDLAVGGIVLNWITSVLWGLVAVGAIVFLGVGVIASQP